MPEDFVASLDTEIDRLQQAVDRIPEVRQLAELKRVRALYSSSGPIKSAERVVIGDHASAVVIRAGRKMAPGRQRALEFVAMLLGQESGPVKTVTLARAIQQAGIDIGGGDPVNSLSALLSTSGQFQAHGRSGWTLKNTPKIEPNLGDPPAPESSFGDDAGFPKNG